MNVLDLFSGIGGFSLGLERAGMRTVAFCEIEPYCRAVLKKHWPNVPIFDDVRELTAAKLRTLRIHVDVICGGFPCQDISNAGQQAGINGERSGLWREYSRLISEIRPSYVIVENVSALLGRGLSRVLGDLASIGYDAEWHCIPASAVGAPHQRDRVWIVAYPQEVKDCGVNEDGSGSENCKPSREPRGRSLRNDLGKANSQRLEGLRLLLERARKRSAWEDGEIICGTDGKRRVCKPGLPLVAHGIPCGMERIGTTGNAVVPQIPELIGRAIMEAEYA